MLLKAILLVGEITIFCVIFSYFQPLSRSCRWQFRVFLSGKVKLLTIYRIVQDVLVFFRDNLDIFVFTFFYGDLQKKNIAYKMKNIDSRKIIYNTSLMRNESWYLRKFFGSFFLV